MPSTEPIPSTQSTEPTGIAAQPFAKTSTQPARGDVLLAREKSSTKTEPKGGPRRFPSAVQTTHFKAFWVKPAEGQASEDLVQTVIPKRLLKKAVDRNGLRRVLREAVRAKVLQVKEARSSEVLLNEARVSVAQVNVAQVNVAQVNVAQVNVAQVSAGGVNVVLANDAPARVLSTSAPPLPTPRVVLTSAKGFAEQPSRHALKGAWREELDRLMALLLLRLKF